jgi:mono/diheme cytochrome c family protein
MSSCRGRLIALALAAAAVTGCGGEETTPAAGEQVFRSAGCANCHTLGAANSSGMVGPDLDKALAGQGTDLIRRSIVDPNARIAPGFPAVMPTDYAERLSDEELRALVDFLAESTSP